MAKPHLTCVCTWGWLSGNLGRKTHPKPERKAETQPGLQTGRYCILPELLPDGKCCSARDKWRISCLHPSTFCARYISTRIPKRFLLSERLFVCFWPLRTCDTCLDLLARCPAKINCLADADHYLKSQDLHKYYRPHCAGDRFCRLFYVTVEQFRHCICIYLQAALQGPSREQCGSRQPADSRHLHHDHGRAFGAPLLRALLHPRWVTLQVPTEAPCLTPGCLWKDRTEASKRENLLQRALLPRLAWCRLQECIPGQSSMAHCCSWS